MNIKFYLSDTWACGHVRGEVIARHINSQTVHQVVCKSDVLYSDMFKTDIMVFQRQCNSGMLPFVAEARRRGIKTICELDDDLFCIPPESEKAFKFYSRTDVQQASLAFMQNVDALTVSTEHLAGQSRLRTNLPIYIVENGVDFDYWEEAFQKHNTTVSDVVTVGWMASGTHTVDATLLKDVIQPLLEKYSNLRVHLVGWVESENLAVNDAFKSRIKTDPWTDISMLPMTMSDFDIGLAPLVDNPFNRSKSGIKYIQYAALGIPCVASPLVPYLPLIKNGEDGFLARDNSTEGWMLALDGLIADADMRKTVGALARKRMREKYDVSVVANNWLSTFKTILKT